MSQKKHKKRKSQPTYGKKPSTVVDPLRDESKSKRLSPAARNLILVGLIILAGGQMLFTYEVIDVAMANITGVVALILSLCALYSQFSFRKEKEKGIRR